MLAWFLSAALAHAQSVTVEYEVLGESQVADTITQSLEVWVTNGGPAAMLGTSATISALSTRPLDALGSAALGDIPVGMTMSRVVTITFKASDEATVRTAPLSFELRSQDAGGTQTQTSAAGQQRQ